VWRCSFFRIPSSSGTDALEEALLRDTAAKEIPSIFLRDARSCA